MIQESAKMLKRKLYDLENVISCKTVEANKLRCVLNETETELQLNRKKLITIQQENSTTDQAVNVLTTKYQAREAELVTMRKVAPERLVQAEQCVDAVCQELATVNAKVAEWKCKAEQSIKMLSELKASSDLELGYDRTLLGELICERHRLVEQQLDKSNQLEKILACNCRLVADSKTVAERKASLSAEVECLEQSKCCDRLALILYQTTSDSEAVLHDDEMAIKFHTLTSVANEVEPLRRACQDRESAISDAKRHLDECCSVRVKVCGGSAK